MYVSRRTDANFRAAQKQFYNIFNHNDMFLKLRKCWELLWTNFGKQVYLVFCGKILALPTIYVHKFTDLWTFIFQYGLPGQFKIGLDGFDWD